MDISTAEGLNTFKFLSQDCQVQVSIDQLEQQLTIRLVNTKIKNVYFSTYNNATLPEDLKTLLSNVKTVYDYIQVNRDNPQKVVIKETGQIHLVFLLSFGPQSQIKKDILLELELKEIGKVEGGDLEKLGDRLREEIIELNKKNKQEREKLKAIMLSTQKTAQKLVCETEQLKLENMYFFCYQFRQTKNKLLILEQKVDALQVLLKDLYNKFEVLKEDKENLERRLEKTKLVAIIPPNIDDPKFKTDIHSLLQDSRLESEKNEESYIKKIKALEIERDEEKKKFEEKIAQQEKRLNLPRPANNQHSELQSVKQADSELGLLNSYLKDSEIQKLRNTVSPNSSSQRSSENSNKQSSQQKFKNQPLFTTPPKRKPGLTGKYYCCGPLCENSNCPKCKTICGPNLGDNCMQCMRLDIQKKGLKKGFLVNANGQVACLQNGHFSCGIGLQNGEFNCGIDEKYCQACVNLTQNYEHRYKQLID